MIGLGLRQPAQQGAETGTFKNLLGGPQSVARLFRLHQQQPPHVDAGLRQGRRAHPVRRRQQDDGFAGSRQPRQ